MSLKSQVESQVEILNGGEGSTLRIKRGQGESNLEILNGVQGQSVHRIRKVSISVGSNEMNMK